MRNKSFCQTWVLLLKQTYYLKPQTRRALLSTVCSVLWPNLLSISVSFDWGLNLFSICRQNKYNHTARTNPQDLKLQLIKTKSLPANHLIIIEISQFRLPSSTIWVMLKVEYWEPLWPKDPFWEESKDLCWIFPCKRTKLNKAQVECMQSNMTSGTVNQMWHRQPTILQCNGIKQS